MSISYDLSVTARIKEIKQPRGGYINPKLLVIDSLGSGIEGLYVPESIHPTTAGLVVDYLTRIATGTPKSEAFRVALLGARAVGETVNALTLLSQINGLDDLSIQSAAQLSGYDVIVRAGIAGFRPVSNIQVDANTAENIRVMVNRTLDFFSKYGPKVVDGFTFEGGYTTTISSGDGDFLTADTLWDMKVSKNRPTKDHTLQLIVYWRMGLHSIHPEFKSIKYLGIYNPRLNEVSRISVSDIPQEIIQQVEREVIGYRT